MYAKKHPDYIAEQDRFVFTKSYIQLLLEAARNNETEYREHIRQAIMNLNSDDSSLGYISLLTNAKFLEMTEREHRHLERVQHRPYFARIDFQNTSQSAPETLYIGKISLFDRESQEDIIVDWRSPIANVYYDGRLGRVSYEVEDGMIEGDLSLKRQYIIEDGALQEIRDIDITTKDELLQQSLGGNAESRLTEIVSTIQEEQNRIIRADLYHPLIVQGVAGSGKTTIALHRIAYYIYKHAQYFAPESMMILAPSKLFLTYISDVLPELGVDQVQQTTFLDFVTECINVKLIFARMDEALVDLLQEEDAQVKREKERLLSFKGSLPFAKMISRYMQDIERSLLPQEDFCIGTLTVYKHERLRRLFLYEYKYLPVYKRIDKLKRVLQNHVKAKKKEMEARIIEHYDSKIERALLIRDATRRKETVIRLMDKKEALLKEFQKECRTAVASYIKKFPKKDVFSYYKELLQSAENMRKYGPEGLSETIIANMTASLRKRKFHYEVGDAAALLYLQHHLYGVKKNIKIKSIIIDEAQDYTLFEMFVLKKVCGTELFTILGDLSQGIHGYRGIKDWDLLIKRIFPKANYLTLQSSYRTTIEIMNVANAVLTGHSDVRVPIAIPVVRHGNRPVFQKYEGAAALQEAVECFVKEGKQHGFKSFALLGRTKEECKELYLLLQEKLPCALMTEQQELRHNMLSILPVHVAKGLEFDCVGIVSYKERFTKDELDVKLMYVAMTRPLHQLTVFAQQEEDVLLNSIERSLLDWQS
ncbi:UvrD-helicase domain-containing protein [Ectobacillus sp. JY-23]|uniref:RNA polymerase recycling motor HelD n=1 Tax=Ectobacillus sp. JY-23 TaxID=2933872 RepID=UPI001FF3F715|nr:RNA polymerase recycling motor HelD [Ectobacillus sp. JY-23]UOY91947.1 UvrD-helicase domain-containing protein [Ectobacillus sp. JY-23]